MSRGINTCIDGNKNSLDVEHVRPASSVLSSVCRKSIHTGCGSQGSCGTCIVLVKGKPRMSCTMRAKNLNNKDIKTIESIPKSFIERLERAFTNRAAIQCGLCLPAITIQLYNLLDHVESPSNEQLLKALSMHSCRCMAPSILIEASKAFLKNNNSGDGWVHRKQRSALCGEKGALMHFIPDTLTIARPIIGQAINFSDGVYHESVEFILRNNHKDNPIFSQNPFLLGFILTTEEWVLDSTEKQLDIVPIPKPQLSNCPPNADCFLMPTELAPLEVEVCTIVDHTLHVNGTEHIPESILSEGYDIIQWATGGTFGHRIWSLHIEWANWLHQHLNVPISVRPTMAQMLTLRPKKPLVALEVEHHENGPVIALYTEKDSSLQRWQSDLVLYIEKLNQSLPSEIQMQTRTSFSIRSGIPQQYSESRILQIGSCLLSLNARQKRWNRISWATQIIESWGLPPSWITDVRTHATLIGQYPNENLGWGLCAFPPYLSKLENELTCSIRIQSDHSFVVTTNIPESDGFLASTLIQLIHSRTFLPIENFEYTVEGYHPDPLKDSDTIRQHCMHAVEQCAAKLNRMLESHPISELVGKHISYYHRELPIPGNGCSVVTKLNNKGDIVESWIAINIGKCPSHSNAVSELSGRWMRSLDREKLLDRKGHLTALYKDVNTLKAKQNTLIHWSVQEGTTRPLPWNVIDGATTASVVEARYKQKRLTNP